MTALVEFFDHRPTSALILGNHDEYLLKCFQGTLDVIEGRKWLWNGGDATLASYGFYDQFNLRELTSTLNRLEPRHRLLLERAVAMVLTERHCFVHAGIDPHVPIEEQDGRTTRWIRDGFLDYPDPFEKIVVHGHSITQTGLPEVLPNRIAVDTGSYQTGRISAAILMKMNLLASSPLKRSALRSACDPSMHACTKSSLSSQGRGESLMPDVCSSGIRQRKQYFSQAY